MSELLTQIAAGRTPLIGMIQLPPLAGGSRYRGAPLGDVLAAALREADVLTRAGFDLLMLQNLGDLPVAPRVTPLQSTWMTRIAHEVRLRSGLPVGLNLLENDAQAMIAVASAAELDFVRIKVFVGAMVTASGIQAGQAFAAIAARNACNADGVAIFADVHDRTGVPVGAADLAEDLRAAFALGGADGVVLTGRSPEETLRFVAAGRAAIGSKPILVGGGVSGATVTDVIRAADGAIVSSALKSDDSLFGELDEAKVQQFMAAVRAARATRAQR